MAMTMTGERAAITGASSGIGAEIALEIARKGGTPVLLARSEDKLAALSATIAETTGKRAPYYTLDVSKPDEVDQVFAKIAAEEGPVTTLINNAGFAVFDYIEDASMKDAEDMMRVNLLGAAACTQAVLPRMRKQRYGRIIFVASLAGKISTPKASIYSASKHALIGFANAVRMETADDPVHISTINPGPVETNFFNIADQSGEYKKNVEKFLLDASYVAEKAVKLIAKPKRELNFPKSMSAGAKIYQLFPGLSEKIAGRLFMKK
ncbi:SDR family NAD(P)-dependent oxidoreductase [Salisediminibacterium halotolerans]|uniref:Short-chain dehydrogenase n=1 Tax=Salisediminibacterium halotolerans TaxID=517425 RepID=A0A1H9PBN5_9BACI|nr:SDR family oxidoreductase [Salisediminibacterium haloalkalitolerans]SER45616.1 hypothetical protein SAMN05444126_101152 [Salisediminibacterium haloalkalitolerans]